LLVAPVLTPVTTTRDVYLPPGGWFDYWTGAHVDGGQTVTWTGADATQLPIYVRDGAIVPRIADDTQTLLDADYVGNPAIKTPDGALDFLIYPSASSHQTIYDGTDVTVAATSDSTTIDVTSAARAMSFDVYSTAHPKRVERDGGEPPNVARGSRERLRGLGL
jgi:alpha-glucosidase (family GH31 glycosyl hydrolase)